MKYALAIIAAAIAFFVGWFLGAPEGAAPTAATSNAPDEQQDKAEPEADERQAHSLRAEAEAAYLGEATLTEDERLALLRRIHRLPNDREDRQLQFLMAIAPMSEAEIVNAIQEALASEDSKLPLNRLFSRWVELNRDAAYQFYLRHSDRDRVRQLGVSVFNDWVLEDQNAALAALEQAPAEHQSNIANSMIWHVMNHDFPQSLELQKLIGPPGRTYAYSSLFQRWAAEDPDAAWAALASVPAGQAQERAISGFFQTLAKTDRELALSLLDSVPNQHHRQRSESTIYNEWLKQDAAGALEAARLAKEPHELFRGWNVPEEARDQVLDWAFANLDGHGQDSLVSSIINRMAQEDPGAALLYINGLPDGEAHRRASASLAREWAKADPEAAIAWVEAMPEGRMKRHRYREVITSIGQDDPAAAKALFESMDAKTQQEAASQIVYTLGNSSTPQETLAWAQTIKDESARKDLTNQIYRNWANNDPTSLFQNMTSEQFAELNQTSTLMSNWATQSPAEAAAWIDNVPENQRTNVIDNVSNRWLDHDPYEASIWISELPQGEGRQEAVENLVNEIYRNDPASALDWSLDIEDEGKRRSLARKALQEWNKSDQEDARATLLASDFSDEDVEYLLKQAFTE